VMSIQYEERREAWPGGMLLDCHMLTPAAALLLLAVVLAGCQSTANLPLSPLPEQLKLTSKVAHAKAAKATRAPKAARAAKLGRAATPVKPVEPAETNPPALGVKLLGEELRVVLLQERLRGLCEIVKVEQLSADSWRTSCAKGDAFAVKIYPDGFMSVTRS
jgi:hypothetical protein